MSEETPARRKRPLLSAIEASSGAVHPYYYTCPGVWVRREQESLFRARLRAWLTTVEAWLPTSLADDILDHLTRRDAQGLSLCFDGPQRAYLFTHLHAWLGRQDAEVQAQVLPTLAAIEALGCHTASGQWNEVPWIVRVSRHPLVEAPRPPMPQAARRQAREARQMTLLP